MNSFAYIVLIAFAPMASLLFVYCSVQHAVLASVVGGFLFLPILEIPLPGLPDYSKFTAISLALILGPLVSGRRLPRIQQIRWWDIAYCLWLIAMPVSYLANGYPLYNALSAIFKTVIFWGVPYWAGRCCFQSPASVRLLLQAIVIGGLINVPLALWEIRMSPQLHTTLYGAFQHSFGQMMRNGGFRPIVFTDHALVLALWFGVTLTAAIALRQAKKLAPEWIQRAWWLLPCFIIMVPLCKSLGAICLSFAAAMTMAFRPFRLATTALLIAAFTYVGARILFDGLTYQVVQQVLEYLPPDRAHSFTFRMDNESLLLAHAWNQPFLGWVNEGFRGVLENGTLVSDDSRKIVSDSLWIIAFGTSGLLGLVSLYSVLFASATRFLWDASVRNLAESKVLGTIVAILLLDTVANGWFGPVATLCTGAALSVHTSQKTGIQPTSSPQHLTVRPLRPRA